MIRNVNIKDSNVLIDKSQKEILDLLDKYEIKISAMISANTPIDIIAGDLGMDVEAVNQFLENYKNKTKEYDDEIAHYDNVLYSINDLRATDTVGLSWTNNIMKAELGKDRAKEAKESHLKKGLEPLVVRHLCHDANKNNSFDENVNLIKKLKELGYEGDYGDLESIRKLIEQLEKAQEQVAELRNENAKKEEENRNLRNENDKVKEENRDLRNENDSVKEENKKLRENVREVIAKAREYKDYVLETIRNMPIIGKLVAKKVEKGNKSLKPGSGEGPGDDGR